MKKLFLCASLFMALILLNGCWESIATGALEQATYEIEQKKRADRIVKLSGLDLEELNIWEDKIKIAADCGEAIENDIEYYPIKIKNPENPTYKHFGDKTFITQRQSEILEWYLAESENCFELAQYYYESPLIIELQMIVDRTFTDYLILYAKLDSQEITWGKFNREEQRLVARYEYKLNEWKRRVEDKTLQAADMVARQEEAAYSRRQREALITALSYDRNQYFIERQRNRRLQFENKRLEMCARYPGQYMNCP